MEYGEPCFPSCFTFSGSCSFKTQPVNQQLPSPIASYIQPRFEHLSGGIVRIFITRPPPTQHCKLLAHPALSCLFSPSFLWTCHNIWPKVFVFFKWLWIERNRKCLSRSNRTFCQLYVWNILSLLILSGKSLAANCRFYELTLGCFCLLL